MEPLQQQDGKSCGLFVIKVWGQYITKNNISQVTSLNTLQVCLTIPTFFQYAFDCVEKLAAKKALAGPVGFDSKQQLINYREWLHSIIFSKYEQVKLKYSSDNLCTQYQTGITQCYHCSVYTEKSG
jgi:hypothetical protein